MIKTYSQRNLPPYYGQVQIAESERARALSLDGQLWEIQFLYFGNSAVTDVNSGAKDIKHSYRRVASVSHEDIRQKKIGKQIEGQTVDDRILELTDFLAEVSLPFPSADLHE